MPEEPTDSLEAQRLKTRRKLLKIGVYSIPIITTIVASREALAQCNPVINTRCPPKGKAQTVS